MIQEILNYKKVMGEIEGLLNNSAYKKNYIISQTGLAPATFYRKLSAQSFTPDEMLALAKILSPREALLLEIEQSEKDIENGNYREHSVVSEELRKKFL